MSTGALDKWWTYRGHLFLWSPLLELVFGAAVECGRAMSHLTRHPIHILKGGYERFSAMYHFFRTQKIIWMPQVRQGAWAQAGLDGAWPSPKDHGMGCRVEQRGEGDRQHGEKMEEILKTALEKWTWGSQEVLDDEFIIIRFVWKPAWLLRDGAHSEGRVPGEFWMVDCSQSQTGREQEGVSWFEVTLRCSNPEDTKRVRKQSLPIWSSCLVGETRGVAKGRSRCMEPRGEAFPSKPEGGGACGKERWNKHWVATIDRQGPVPGVHYVISGLLKSLTAMECKHAQVSFFPIIAFNCALILVLRNILDRFHVFWPLLVMKNFSLVM